MFADKIIGRVAATILDNRLDHASQGLNDQPESAAIFRLDKLAPSQIAAVVREVLGNAKLADRVDIKIPRMLVEGENLPEAALTRMNAGAVRNAGTSKDALLTANGNEQGLADTLGHVTALGAKELRAYEEAWVEATCHVASLAPTFEDRKVFQVALKGLVSVTDMSLIQLGEFCSKIAQASHPSMGLPIRMAIGWSLPCVDLPRDTAFFGNDRTYGQQVGAWRKAFEKLYQNRSPLLARQRPNSQPIDPEDMRQRFEENIAGIPDAARVVLEAFINAPAGDKDTASAVAELEWESDGVHLIFEKPREKLKGLADSTVHFFQHVCSEHDALDAQWLKHLEDLKTREKRSDWNDDDEIFFNLHRRYLEQDPKLLSRWEKVIYGKPIECVDFFEGFTSAAHHLIVGSAAPKGERFLRITVNKGRKEWRERFNHDVGSYFSAMHRGLKELMGAKVDWKVLRMGTADLPDPLFKYPAYFAKEQSIFKGNTKPVVSVAKASMQIKFEVTLLERMGDKEEVIEKTQLLWMFKPDSMGLSLVDDMERLREKGAVGCTEVPRRLVSKKGGVQSVSLLDTNTLEATFSRDAGSLVPPPAKMKSFRADIKARIKDLADQGRLSVDQRDTLRAAWEEFESDYIKAMDDFIAVGLHGEAVLKQADSFAALLRALSVHARGDVCRLRLVAEILKIGTVRVSGEQPCVIIPPWHPERMKALAVKTRRVAGLVTHMLAGEKVLFGDRGIFFREFAEELAHPFYPEIAVVQRNGAPVLLSESSTVNGYSLLERPVRGEEDMLTDVDPSEAAKQVQELLARYVGLQPHEASNLSVLLYNADAAELPLAVVRELSADQSESEFQCAVAVRHREPSKLRRVYAELVTKAGDDPDLPVVSETSENFISKLRIAVVPSSATPSTANATFKPFDIAFLHDVVSRTAAAEWIPVDWANERPSLEHAPSRWSYRSVSGENELKSTTFLTCPRQTATGWAYVGAVGSVARQTDLSEGQRFLPARRISVQSQALSETLNDAHALAEWVATYDELLDKRQLQANGVTIVRYRRASTNGRNMIVSSTSELRLLSVLTRRRLTELGLAMPAERFDDLANRIKKDALSVSGDIVLRAAKRGVSAGEMLGLVMSRFLIHSEFKALSSAAPQTFTVFFLLDDYAGWLAQKENRIADILALCVEERDGVPHLHIAVVESKYVTGIGAAEAKKSSRAQLLATLSTFRAAIFGDPGRLDRDVWLARLADLLIDADVPPGCFGLLERARSELREGKAKISLRGYSHVFIHSADAGTSGSASEQSLIESDQGVEAWQEVFDRPELRSLVESYAAKADPASVRAKLGPMEPWLAIDAKEPAARVTWTAMMDLLAVGAEPMLEVPDESVPSVDPLHEEFVEPALTAPAQAPVVVQATAAVADSPAAPQVTGDGSNALADLIASKSAALAGKIDERGAWADEMTRKLKTALNGYGLQAAVLGTRLTPNGCLVRLAGSDRLRVEDIEAKRMQLLTTHAINLVTVQPKPGEIVVTMAGEKRQSVSLWDLWAKRQINRNAAGINTSFVLGLQEINGSLLYLNLGGEFGGLSSHEPHSLVAGATGSGKSVLIQAILLDIAATNPKELAQIILIDPKMGVDYSALEDLPHMREPIVTTRERATTVLEALVEEMESRYRLFAGARARDLTTFNAKAEPESRLPMLFLVHDEFADWMLDDGYKQAVSAAVQRLGVKARAAGIHLIFAAQRPDKDVMPMQLRENLGNRLILKVASEATSKIALDRPGAEMLLGKGHLAAKLNGEQGLVFAQAPYLSDSDIEAVVSVIVEDAIQIAARISA
ncbi:FtsK/SpoIIIE domain-containing protein [Polaromonas naphthalenivorans]|nr:FtsK/SpoIIIE domain-containing protein [Polaromonas naphthalenivorans]